MYVSCTNVTGTWYMVKVLSRLAWLQRAVAVACVTAVAVACVTTVAVACVTTVAVTCVWLAQCGCGDCGCGPSETESWRAARKNREGGQWGSTQRDP